MGKSKSPLARERRHQKAIAAAAVELNRIAELKLEGASCGICRHSRISSQPHRAWGGNATNLICLLHSDGGGVLSPVAPSHVCTDFSREPTP